MAMPIIEALAPVAGVVGVAGIVGWVVTTWMRIRHGYPLEPWEVGPKANEAIERIKLLGTENAQLRAELAVMKERLANVERIVTDDSHRLTHEIEALRMPSPAARERE